MSHVSTVPKSTSPRSARALRPGVLSRSHWILVPEKYASTTKPVFSAMADASPAAFSRSQHPAVRLHCHTMAFAAGRPVALSQRIVVSRWFVMPMAAMSPADAPARAMASWAVASCVPQISMGSCSTQPGRGYSWVNSLLAIRTLPPSRSKRIALELVVPWSSASKYSANSCTSRLNRKALPRAGQQVPAPSE